MSKMKYNPLTGQMDYIGEGGSGGGDLSALQLAVRELQDATFPLSVTLSSSRGTVEYTADPVTTKLTWTSKRKGEYIVPSYVKITGNGLNYELEPPTSYTGTVNSDITAKGTTTFSLTVKADGITKTASVNVSRILPFWMGFAAKGKTLQEMITEGTLTKYVVTSWSAKSFDLTNESDDVYLVIALPDNNKISSITAGGFEFPLTSLSRDSSVSILGTSYAYNLYYSANKIAGSISGLKITTTV